MMTIFSLWGKPVVLKRLVHMTLKIFPMHSHLTQLLSCMLELVFAGAVFKSSCREWRSKLAAKPQPSRRLPWNSPATVSGRFQALFFSPCSTSPSQSFTKRPGPVKCSRTEQHASFCVFKTTSSVMTDNCSLATKSVTGIGNPPGWYLALKS